MASAVDPRRCRRTSGRQRHRFFGRYRSRCRFRVLPFSAVTAAPWRPVDASLEFPDLTVADPASGTGGFWEPLEELLPKHESGWTCEGEYWERDVRIFAASYLGLGDSLRDDCGFGHPKGLCLQERLAAAYTWRPEAAHCPAGMAVIRLLHLVIWVQRDCLGDYGLCGLQKAALLRTSAFRLEVTLLQRHLRHVIESAFGWLLFHLIQRLASEVCDHDEDGVERYLQLCRVRPWILGCPNALRVYPFSCRASATEHRGLEACVGKNVSLVGKNLAFMLRRLAKCLSFGTTMLDQILLLRPFAQDLERIARESHHQRPLQRRMRSQRNPFAACDRSYLSTDFLPRGLCASIQQTIVLDGELIAIFFVASARALEPTSCGFLFEFHLRVEPVAAPCAFFPCSAHGAHCREQCEGWAAANFMRFACQLPDGTLYPGSTHSGMGTGIEPSMHLIIACRVPEASLDVLLVDLDGFWDRPAVVRFCSFGDGKLPFVSPVSGQRLRVAACLKPNYEVDKHRSLFDEWIRYHILLGIDHFFLYDSDSSAKEASQELVAAGLATYTGRFTETLGSRFERLAVKSKAIGGGMICVEKLQVNHCMGMARSRGFDWLIYLRNLDKFLHADPGIAGPRMLRDLLDEIAPRSSQILLHRHDCGGRDKGEKPRFGRNKTHLKTVFSRWPNCVTFEETKRDTSNSYVPLMNLRDTHWALSHTGTSYSRSEPVFSPIDLLRAQHFVSAFSRSVAAHGNHRSHGGGGVGGGIGGGGGGHRGIISSVDLEDPRRFTSIEGGGVHWAAPLLHVDLTLQAFLTRQHLHD